MPMLMTYSSMIGAAKMAMFHGSGDGVSMYGGVKVAKNVVIHGKST